MRTIEFRGKTENLSEWVYGDLLGDSTIIPPGQVFEIDEGYIDDQIEAYSVLPETIGQYIGRRDVNGNKIFEGDVLKFDFGKYTIGVQYAVIEWHTKYSQFCLKPLNNWQYANVEECEIIGNIHDNPELEKRINNNVLG